MFYRGRVGDAAQPSELRSYLRLRIAANIRYDFDNFGLNESVRTGCFGSRFGKYEFLKIFVTIRVLVRMRDAWRG